MNTTQIADLRSRLNAAHALDPQDPMSIQTPHLDAAIAEMGEARFGILLACEDAIRQADSADAFRRLKDFRTDPVGLRSLICSICSGHKFWMIHHMAEAIFSAAGLADGEAWDAGHIGIHVDLERCDAGEFGEAIVTVAR